MRTRPRTLSCEIHLPEKILYYIQHSAKVVRIFCVLCINENLDYCKQRYVIYTSTRTCITFECTFKCIYCCRELEAAHNLDPDCEADLFALHYVFMPLLKQEVQEFVTSWNRHKLRTEGNCTPLQLFITGLTNTDLQDTVSSSDVCWFQCISSNIVT